MRCLALAVNLPTVSVLATTPVQKPRSPLVASKLMRSGFYRTAAGDLSAELLKRNASSLRHYLTIRLRDAKLASQAYEILREAIDAGHRDDLKKPPGPRAHLFKLARNIVAYLRVVEEGLENKTFNDVPWDVLPNDRPANWSRAIDIVRATVGEEDLELVELKLLHGLREEEVAHVVETKKAIGERASSTLAWVRMLLEDEVRGPLPKDESIVEDLFATMLPAVGVASDTAAPEPPRLNPGTVLGERYEIDACVGGGAFAYVYRARDVKVPSHVVALKLLHKAAITPAARDGALSELALLASAFHPSLVHFKSHGWHEDRLWFAMPWYEGETLQARLERGPMSWPEAQSIFAPVTRAVAALHAAGIRHQDLKPENIFLARLKDGSEGTMHPVVLDLGAASQSGDMLVAGTPMYFAPEVAARFTDAEADAPMTAKADVFALGLSMLHALEPPDASLLDNLDIDAFVKERSTKSPLGPQLPQNRAIATIIEKALCFDPQARPTAEELAKLIESHGERKSRAPSMALPSTRAWMMAVVVLLAIAGVVLAARDVVTSTRTHGTADRTEADLAAMRARTAQERAHALEQALERTRRSANR